MSEAVTIDSVAPFTPRLTAVVASTPDGVIGLNGEMPWRLRSDLQRFKALTMGGWLIMGRKTFDSIGRPLPGRQTLVLTRNSDWSSAGVTVAHDPAEALRITADRPAYVVGGAEIYRLLWNHCDQLFLTTVWAKRPGDTRLEIDCDGFMLRERVRLPAGANDDYPSEFTRWQRNGK